MVEQVAFVNNDDRFEVVQTAQELNFTVELAFGIATIELGLDAQLFQQTFVEMVRCQLRVGDVENLESLLVAGFLEPAMAISEN